MPEKIRDLAIASIPGSDYWIRIEFWNRYGKDYEHIARYNEYRAIISNVHFNGPGWDLSALDACSLDQAKEDIELLALQFGFAGRFNWQDL